ncbi:type II secretion system protein J [Bacteriovorax stolpii]|nr:type II secretion system protein J [Bacteriovorax stolpii]
MWPLDHSKTYSPLKNNQGFTLFEVMIAITILSMISFATYKMIDTNTETKDRVIKEDRQTVQSLTAIGRLDSDISQIYNPLFSNSKIVPTASNSADVYADTNTNANGAFDGRTNNGSLIPQFKSEEKSSIIFLTQANRRKFADSKESRFAWVKYSLRAMEPDPDNPDDKVSGLYEVVRQTIATDIYNSTQDWSKPKFQVVMDKVKELEFSFWDERTKKYTTSLQELNENKNLIRSLKVNVTWIDEDKNEQKLEKTFRVLNPYFNTKQDDIKTGALGGTGGDGSQQGGGFSGGQGTGADQPGEDDDN